MATKKESTTPRKAPAAPPAAPAKPAEPARAKPQAQEAQGASRAKEQPAQATSRSKEQPALQTQGSSRGTTSRRSAEEIARRAYELWLQRGAPHGSDQEDWHRAERELNGHTQH